ncbi:MAG: LapA family protein [bacterium]|nr:LapA family protein [bacterium]
MIILFIVGLLVGAVSVVFVLQNVAIVTVTFFSYQLTGSLALILSLAIGAGALVVVLLLLPESISNYFKYKHLKKENEKLTEELRKQKELTVFSKQVPPTQEEISKIEHGVSDSGAL